MLHTRTGAQLEQDLEKFMHSWFTELFSSCIDNVLSEGKDAAEDFDVFTGKEIVVYD